MSTRSIKTIEVKKIKPFLDRARDPEEFELLKQSIKDIGLKIPISLKVTTSKSDRKAGIHYIVFKGHGRLRAHKELKADSVLAFVYDKMPDKEMVKAFLVENEVRASLPAVHKAELMRVDRDMGMTIDQITEKYRLSKVYVKACIRLIETASVKVRHLMQSGVLSLKDAQAVSVLSKKEQNALLGEGGLKSEKLRDVIKTMRVKGQEITSANLTSEYNKLKDEIDGPNGLVSKISHLEQLRGKGTIQLAAMLTGSKVPKIFLELPETKHFMAVSGIQHG